MGLEIKHTIKGRTLGTALETMACHTRWPVISGFGFPNGRRELAIGRSAYPKAGH